LLIWPNPAKNKIFVNCPKGYQILSLCGKILMQSNESSSEIDIQSLTEGTYILKTDNQTQKFIKK
jgi:hypothetical protein